MVQYQLVAINGAGSGISRTRIVQLPLEAPTDFPEVNAQALGPTSVRVDWSFGEEADLRNVEKYIYEVVVQDDLEGPQEEATTTVATPERRVRRAIEEGLWQKFTVSSNSNELSFCYKVFYFR